MCMCVSVHRSVFDMSVHNDHTNIEEQEENYSNTEIVEITREVIMVNGYLHNMCTCTCEHR